MKIIYKKGNLFNSQLQAFAHGCNTTGRMGAGIAKEFKFRYIDMYKQYKYLCGIGEFDPGSCFIYKTADNKYIFNLATQSSLAGANVEFINKTFETMKDEMFRLKINSVAMPKIGTGLGELNWNKDILPVLKEIFSCEDIIIEVWDNKTN